MTAPPHVTAPLEATVSEVPTDQVGASLVLPEAPIAVLDAGQVQWFSPEGEVEILGADQFSSRVFQQMPIVCHAPFLAGRLGIDPFMGYDILELFAFVHPGHFVLPTPKGLAKHLGMFVPEGAENDPVLLLNIARHLLQDLIEMKDHDHASDPLAAAWIMAMGQVGYHNDQGWPWAKPVLHALGHPQGPVRESMAKAGVQIWHRLEEWSETGQPAPPAHYPVKPDEAEQRLSQLLSSHGQDPRAAQAEYTREIAAAFDPVVHEDETHSVLAEAGTGIGKTLGYLAPATVWAEKNEGSVWISTYTRNLQRQIDQELDRLYQHDPKMKQRKVVVRKGRENYLCLLNLEDAVHSASLQHNAQNAIAVGLMTRWAAVTRDGDLTGGDFPGWLVSLLGWGRTYGLSDRRGECLYGACQHYSKCFIEKSKRRAKHADIVVANHALVMSQSAMATESDRLPSRYIFDEAHHVFESADSAFACHLSGVETADLRRWILGGETRGQKTRVRGLERRVSDLVQDDDVAEACVADIMEAARALPGQGWRARLRDEKPRGVAENFLAMVRAQVYARAEGKDMGYSLETEIHPLSEGMFEAGNALSIRLNDLKRPMEKLIKVLRARLEDSEQFELMSAEDRQKIDSITNSIKRRTTHMVDGWIKMLDHLRGETPEDYVDWFGVERIDGRDYDIGMFRHWVDPAYPFAATLKPYAHGVVMTSASLRDSTGDDVQDWQMAEQRTALSLLSQGDNDHDQDSVETPVTHVLKTSPFDYQKKTRILVVKDIPKNDMKQVAGAYKALNIAAGGGVLNLFTAIQRQKSIYDIISQDLEQAGYSLYAQHLDGLDVSTLINMFRDDENSILFGTDATRDGMDVPGRSLRMIVFDRVPWPRPNILHKARRARFGRAYDELLTRARLKQAYGRLIRGPEDRGIFVMLDSMLPTRICSAFPDGVDIERISCQDALGIVKEFFSQPS